MKLEKNTLNFLILIFIFGLLYFLWIPYLSKITLPIDDIIDWYSYLFSKKYSSSLSFIGIAIDEYSLNKISQRWPWKRSIYAKVLEVLKQERVRAVGIDLVFSGESEDKKEDLILAQTLNNLSPKVVLACLFDYNSGDFLLPAPELKNSSAVLGIINTPQDIDGKVRRLRGYIKFKDEFYYSFAVMLASAYLNKPPQEIIKSISLLKDKTFYLNYVIKPADILKISFYDLLENLKKLKQEYGENFLRDSLVVIYPEAEVLHDIYPTPLGRISGGLLHLNGVANIVLGKIKAEANLFSFIFLIGCLFYIYYILRSFGFFVGFILVFGVYILLFWIVLFLGLRGMKIDFSGNFVFGFLFFVLGNIYKYVNFLSELLKIKHKANIEPLSGLFSMRYFYYRIILEQKQIHLRKALSLVLISLDGFKDFAKELSLEKRRSIWKQINTVLTSMKEKVFWALYSQEEIIGYLVCPSSRIEQMLNFIKNDLDAIFNENDLSLRTRIAYVILPKNIRSLREKIYILSRELKTKKEDLVLVKDIKEDPRIDSILETSLIESIEEDIEEKNRQLLGLLDNLSREYYRTKEAYFQIITSLVKALEARDPYTEGHSERVSIYCLAVASRLGWSEERKDKLKKAALLHDIGKIGIPDVILHKKEKLSEEEWEFIKKHEIISVKILEPLKELQEILPWIVYHHERWDGKGYPHGLAGEAIPQEAQIIALSDVFDALTSGRDYKKAFSWDEAIKEISNNKGTQFNPFLADIFIEVILGLKPK